MTKEQRLMIEGIDLLMRRFNCIPDDTHVTISKIIEILNKVYNNIKENNSEFCEWTEYNYKTIRSPHNRDWSIPGMKDFKICPYCGKDIKVIKI